MAKESLKIMNKPSNAAIRRALTILSKGSIRKTVNYKYMTCEVTFEVNNDLMFKKHYVRKKKLIK